MRIAIIFIWVLATNIAGAAASPGQEAAASGGKSTVAAVEWETLYRSGETMYHKGDYLAALGVLEKAHQVALAEFGEPHRRTASTLSATGDVLGKLGRHAEAERFKRRALAMQDDLGLGEHPEAADNAEQVGHLLQAQGRHAESVPLFRRAVATREKLAPSGDRALAVSLNNLGSALHWSGQSLQALALLERAMAMLDRTAPQDTDARTAVRANLAALRNASAMPDAEADKPLIGEGARERSWTDLSALPNEWLAYGALAVLILLLALAKRDRGARTMGIAEPTAKPTLPRDGTGGTDVDPLAEAEVYLTYGRREQAIEILNDALRASPARQDIRKRLAEIAAAKDARGKSVPSDKKASRSLERQVVTLVAICFLVFVAIHIAGLRFGFRFEFDYRSDIPHIVFEDPLSWAEVWSRAPSGILLILIGFVAFIAFCLANNRR